MDMHAQEQEEWVRILALEHEIREEWARIQELESREIQDEGEEFFNSLDPESWEDKNETPFLFRLTKQLRKWNRENFEESTDSIGGQDASSKRLKGVAARWNPRGFGFIIPEDGGDDIFCILSSITDGNALREGDIVEYEAEYDDRRGKYQAIKVTLTARNARKKRKKRTKLPAPAPATGGGYPTSTYGAPAGYGYAAPASYGGPTYSAPQSSNWCVEKIEVKVVSGEYIDRTGVVQKLIGSDYEVRLYNGGVTTVPSEDLEPVAAQKNNSVIIIQGELRGNTGKLIGIDGRDGIVKMDLTLEIKIVDMPSLAIYVPDGP